MYLYHFFHLYGKQPTVKTFSSIMTVPISGFSLRLALNLNKRNALAYDLV